MLKFYVKGESLQIDRNSALKPSENFAPTEKKIKPFVVLLYANEDYRRRRYGRSLLHYTITYIQIIYIYI